MMQVKLNVIAGPHQGREFAFDGHENFIVGRGPQAHLKLPKLDPYFSRLHFMVEINPPHCRLLDLNSRNGTRVNKRKVKSVDLVDGDLIRAGKTVLRVEIVDEEPAPSTSHPPAAGANAAVEAVVPDVVSFQGGKILSPAQSPELIEELLPSDDVEPGGVVRPEDLAHWLPADYERKIRERAQPIRGYELIDELGRGGMGVVYLAIRQRDGSVCAVKTILPAVAAGSKEIERFLREARILEQLRHPHIVPFREMGESGGLLYFAMEFVPGEDAAGILKRNVGPLPIGRAVRLVCQMLDALQFAHARGFVHRDIKPANLLVTQAGRREIAKLADFGLARTWQDSKLSGLTMTGDIAGTAPYMPPEQITDYRNARPAVDQYAAAATLYNLLTCRYVYDFPSDLGLQLVMILQDDPVPIQQCRPDLPDRLALIIHKALAKGPADRFPDVGRLREMLLPFAMDS